MRDILSGKIKPDSLFKPEGLKSSGG